MLKKFLRYVPLVLLLGCAKEAADLPDAPEVGFSFDRSIVTGELCVKFDEETVSRIEAGEFAATKAAGVSSLGEFTLERVFPDAGQWEPRSRRAGLHRWYLVNYGSGAEPAKAADELLLAGGVEFAEPVRRKHVRAVFDDPYLKYQWHYANPVSKGSDINVGEVWENYTVGSAQVIVAVVDEGVQLNHPDLAWNAIPAGENGSWNCVKNSSALVIGEHGTHVAGTIAAVNNNGIGVSGIAGGDYAAGIRGVSILSCQIFQDDDEESASDAVCARAIKWGADHGAVISQNSWGDEADTNQDGEISPQEEAVFRKRKCPRVIEDAINYFVENAGCDNEGNQLEDSPMKGGVVFFAAGNENLDFDPICTNVEAVIAVGAFGPTGRKASYSQYGDWVDIAAPGGDSDVSFKIENLSQPYIYSTVPTSRYGYKYWEGTSMACPHASGVAALVVSYQGGPGFTAEDLRKSMLEYQGESISTIGKKLDALKAVTFLGVGNYPPEVAGSLPGYDLAYGKTEEIDLSGVFTDKNGDELTYTVESDLEGLGLRLNGQTLIIEASAYGVYHLSVKASDGKRFSKPVSFTVGVRMTGGTGAVDIYPNPVKKYVYVRGSVQPIQARIRISSSSGTVVYLDDATISLEQPHRINLVDSAPGKYTVTVTAGGTKHTQTIVKL